MSPSPVEPLHLDGAAERRLSAKIEGVWTTGSVTTQLGPAETEFEFNADRSIEVRMTAANGIAFSATGIVRILNDGHAVLLQTTPQQTWSIHRLEMIDTDHMNFDEVATGGRSSPDKFRLHRK